MMACYPLVSLMACSICLAAQALLVDRWFRLYHFHLCQTYMTASVQCCKLDFASVQCCKLDLPDDWNTNTFVMINTATLPQLEQISKEHYVFVSGEWGKVHFESKLHHKSQKQTSQAINSKKTREHYLLHQTGMKGGGSRTTRIGLVNQEKIKVNEQKRHCAFLCAEHLYFQDQHLFSCVDPLLVCCRVLNRGRVVLFWCFSVIFKSLIANLTWGTSFLQNETLTVLRCGHSR